MRAMLTVAGKDRTGVIAKISNTLFEHNVNIVDVRQNIMGGDLFAMIMLVELKGLRHQLPVSDRSAGSRRRGTWHEGAPDA